MKKGSEQFQYLGRGEKQEQQVKGTWVRNVLSDSLISGQCSKKDHIVSYGFCILFWEIWEGKVELCEGKWHNLLFKKYISDCFVEENIGEQNAKGRLQREMVEVK